MTASTEEHQTPMAPQLGKGIREYQRRVLEFQKNAFDASFDAYVTFQEQQGQFFTDMVDRTNGIPEEGKQLVRAWTETFRRGRESYKATVDKSYDLMLQMVSHDQSEDTAA